MLVARAIPACLQLTSAIQPETTARTFEEPPTAAPSMAYTTPTYRTIPGSFTIERTPPSKLDTKPRERPHLYQTPSASSSLHLSTTSSTNGTSDDNSSRSRKRLRSDSASFESSIAPYSATPSGWTDLASGQSSFTSPAPFVNTRYTLAGGLDTPAAAAASAFEQDDYGYSHSRTPHQRGHNGEGRARGSHQDGYSPYVPAALSRESNGRSRAYHPPAAQDGWGKAVFDVLGGVAGKVWDFCTVTAFRGFYAGGGTGFQMRQATGQTMREEQSMRQYVVERDDASTTNDRDSTPVPGHFPDEDFVPGYMATQAHSTPPRAAKKLQRTQGEGALKANWVLVSSTPRTRSTSPSRSSTRKVPAAKSQDRVRPAQSLASRAGAGHRPIVPASRPPSLTSLAGSPTLHPSRAASFASPRSPDSTSARKTTKSVSRSPEAKAYAAKARRREVEDDASIRRLNRQLKAMIREGKEALGTRVEVEMDERMDGLVDEGYAEGEGFWGKGGW